MKIKDHYFSKEFFTLLESEKGILKTQEIPDTISEYYNSENYISHKNKNKSLLEKVYSSIQKLNFNYKYKIISKYFQQGKILDYGCGNGQFLEFLSTKNKYELYGYEPNLKLESNTITYYSSQNEINEKFDVIMLWHVFEHIENRTETLDFLRSKLTKNGILVIAIPNYTSFDAKFYGKNWAAWDVPRHIYHYSKKGAIEYFTKKEHLYLDKIYPLPFDSFYISILSAKYKNTILQKLLSPFVASTSNLSAIFTNEWSSLVYVLKNELNN